MKYAGFQTSQGSIYAFDGHGQTTRLKISNGKGQGELHHPSFCMFVDDRGFAVIEDLYLGFGHHGNRIGLGSHSAATGSFTERQSIASIPDGEMPCMIVQERASRKVLASGPVKLEPALGLHPVEKTYEGENSIVHIGNTITRLFDSPADLLAATLEVRMKLAAEPKPQRPVQGLSL